VGLGRSEATISTADLVVKALTLRGARGGRPVDFRAAIDLIANGDLSIHASTTTFEEIREAIERLKDGDVIGRIVAIMD
jgi:propanol-preferring alcohol dehydrogenase